MERAPEQSREFRGTCHSVRVRLGKYILATRVWDVHHGQHFLRPTLVLYHRSGLYPLLCQASAHAPEISTQGSYRRSEETYLVSWSSRSATGSSRSISSPRPVRGCASSHRRRAVRRDAV